MARIVTAANDDSAANVVRNFGRTVGGNRIDTIVIKEIREFRIHRRRDGSGFIFEDPYGRTVAQIIMYPGQDDFTVAIPRSRYCHAFYRRYQTAAAAERAFIRQAERHAYAA